MGLSRVYIIFPFLSQKPKNNNNNNKHPFVIAIASGP